MTKPEILLSSSSGRVVSVLVSLVGPDWPHLEPPPTHMAQQLYLSSAWGPLSFI